MAHRSPDKNGSAKSTSRGNRRTRGGAGRHNLAGKGLNGPLARIRVCLGCDRPFRSRGPWNRFCGRCRERDVEQENTRTYRVPREWRDRVPFDVDDF
jgi:hypothetical protein